MVKSCNTLSLILRTRSIGEADRLVTLFTWEKGKIAAVARGARKTRSKLASGVDLFTYAFMSLYRGKSLYTVTQVQVKHRFVTFHGDPLRYAYATYLAELVERFLPEEEPFPEIGDLLWGGWDFLDKGGDPELLCRFFELKILLLGGYAPHLRECSRCLQTAPIAHFSVADGGVLCAACGKNYQNALKISPGTASLGGYLMMCSYEVLFRVKASSGQLKELKKLNLSLMSHYLEIHDCQSLKYLKKWEKNGGGIN